MTISFAAPNSPCVCFTKDLTQSPTLPLASTTASSTTAPPVGYVQATFNLQNGQNVQGLESDFKEAQGVAKNGKLYVFGGFKDGFSFMSKKSWRYMPTSNSWEQLADIPTLSAGITHMGNAVDPQTDMIYLAGGLALPFGGTWISNAFATADVFAYDTDSDQWSSLPSLPQAIGGCGAAVLDGNLHVIGGALMDGANGGFIQDLDTHYVLNLGNPAAGWSTLAPISAGRNHIGVAVGPDRKIYVIGGQHLEEEGCSNFATVEAYDATTNTWQIRTALPHGIGHVAPSTIGTAHGIIVVGGVKDNPNGVCSPPGVSIPLVHHYDPTSNAWSVVNSNKAGPSMVSGIIGNHLYSQSGNQLFKHAISWTNPVSPVRSRRTPDVSTSGIGQAKSYYDIVVFGLAVGVIGIVIVVVKRRNVNAVLER